MIYIVDAKGSTRRWFKQVTVDEFESKGKILNQMVMFITILV